MRRDRLFDLSSDLFVVAGFDGFFREVNPAWEKTLGWSKAEMTSRPFIEFVHPDDREDTRAEGDRLHRRGEQSRPFQNRYRHRDGSYRTLLWTTDPSYEEGVIYAVAKDVTELEATEQDLRDARNRFVRAFTSAPIGMVLVSLAPDAPGRFVEVNDAFCRLVGRSREELLASDVRSVTHPDDVDANTEDLGRLVRGEASSVRMEKRYVRPDGDVIWGLLESTIIEDPSGPPLALTQVQDVTEARRAREELEARARQQGAVVALGERALEGAELSELMDEAVAQVIERLDVQLCKLMELTPETDAFLLRAGAGWRHGLVGSARVPTGPASQSGYCLEVGEPVLVADLRAEDRFTPADFLWEHGVLSGVSVIVRGQGAPFGILSAHSTVPERFGPDDVSFLQAVANVLADAIERQRAEQSARHQALHDPLTGLPNRLLFLDRVTHAVERSARSPSASAVLFVDVDHFKLVNDSLGHQAGDVLLKALPHRLASVLRPADTIGRFGGDEFLVLCEDLESEHDAVRLAERVVGAFADPFVIAGDEHFTTASVGVAFTGEESGDAASLIRDADAAMYRAKQRGRSRFELFDEDMRTRAGERRRTENALYGALERGEMRLSWQPLVSLEDGCVEGCEALLRWDHPLLGSQAPGQFVEVAEDSGHILAIGRWVLEAACREGNRFAEAAGRPVPVYVNVSARQVLQLDFATTVADTLEATGLDPSQLRLEITESLLIEDSAPLEALITLKESGVGLVLDDFGRGYSSLSYLHRFPIDILKIDRSFAAGLPAEDHSVGIVTAVLAMSRALGVHAVAEGVETGEQLACLKGLGCRSAQGHLFAPAVAAAEARKLLSLPFGVARADAADSEPPPDGAPALRSAPAAPRS